MTPRRGPGWRDTAGSGPVLHAVQALSYGAAAGEGLLLFVMLWLFSARQRALGQVSGMFLIGYGVLRFVAEYFREPDHGIFGLSYVVSMGQWLSLPMILVGLWFLLRQPRTQS